MSRREKAIRETISCLVNGLLFFFWIGLAGGYDGQRIDFAQFLGSTVLLIVIGICVYLLCDRNLQDDQEEI